jgi:hypothetical protein
MSQKRQNKWNNHETEESTMEFNINLLDKHSWLSRQTTQVDFTSLKNEKKPEIKQRVVATLEEKIRRL